MAQRPLTQTEPENISLLRAEYESGDEARVLAERWGLNIGQVYNRLHAGNVSMRGTGPGKGIKIGTTWTDPQGYIREKVALDWPYLEQMGGAGSRRDWVWQHRKVVADALGRALLPTEEVHHINGDRTDNRIENLQLRARFHGVGQTWRCNCCGSEDVSAVEI